MNKIKIFFFNHPNMLRWGFNLWPPFLFNGIWVEHIAVDYLSARVRLRSSPLTRNINGSQYGGNLFSMTDPIYATLLLGVLGFEQYYVWDRSAEIDYQKPGRGTVFFEAKLTPEFIEKIRKATQNGDKYHPVIHGKIVNTEGETIAEVIRTLYVRLRPEYRPQQAQ